MTLSAVDNFSVAVSDTWTVTGWNFTYVQLTPGSVYEPPLMLEDEEAFLKLVCGTVLEIYTNGVLRDDGH